jgi:predicted patatin/cPLA2 family phospholipase
LKLHIEVLTEKIDELEKERDKFKLSRGEQQLRTLAEDLERDRDRYKQEFQKLSKLEKEAKADAQK